MSERNRRQAIERVVRKEHPGGFEISTSRKGHYCVELFGLPTRTRLFTSSTPSDRRHLMNFRTDVRRVLSQSKEQAQ